MANDASQRGENPVWQEHYRRWNAINAMREKQREAAFAGFRERQAQLEPHPRSGGQKPSPHLPASGLTAPQQHQAMGYNNRQRQALRSRPSMPQAGQAGASAPVSAMGRMPASAAGNAQSQPAVRPAQDDGQQRMAQLARARTVAQKEQRLAQIRKLQQAIKAAQWGFRIGEAGGILSVIGALGSLLAMNLQLVFGNFFRGKLLIPVPPLSKVEKWATIGADLLVVFLLLLALAPLVLAFAFFMKYQFFLQFLPAEWLAQQAL